MKMRKVAFVLGLLAFTAWPRGGQGREPSEKEARTAPSTDSNSKPLQLLVVLADTWNSHQGTLWRFSSRAGTKSSPIEELVAGEHHFRPQGEPIPVALGRNGLAWGHGWHAGTGNGHLSKREGDGRSPAGIFTLGTAFGSAKELPESSHGYPYLSVGSTDYCVEDTRSEFYNQFIDSRRVESRGWRKWSALKRADGLFRWGVFVNQNTNPTSVGAGSCIFLHIWRGPGIGTSGCTAMPSEAISAIIRWLDPHSHPILVQLPRTAYLELAENYHLPREL